MALPAMRSCSQWPSSRTRSRRLQACRAQDPSPPRLLLLLLLLVVLLLRLLLHLLLLRLPLRPLPLVNLVLLLQLVVLLLPPVVAVLRQLELLLLLAVQQLLVMAPAVEPRLLLVLPLPLTPSRSCRSPPSDLQQESPRPESDAAPATHRRRHHGRRHRPVATFMSSRP